MNKKKAKTKKSEDKHMMRFRPKGSGAAYYAPSADVTQGMKGILSSVLKGTFPGGAEEYPEGDPSRLFAHDLALFMKLATMGKKTWEEDGMDKLNEAFDNLHPKDATTFLYKFFLATMDYYWHAMRLIPDSTCIDPEEMQKAIEFSTILRTMPADMRKEYLDHLQTYNRLPEVFYQGGLFEQVRGEPDDK